MTCSVVLRRMAISLFLQPWTMSATIFSSLGVRRSRTREPTESSSIPGSFHAGGADVAVSLTDVADAVDEGRAGDVTMGGAVDAGVEPGLHGLAVFGNDDTAAAGGEDARDESLRVEFESRRKDQDCATKGVEGGIEAVSLGALCNDAEVIFHSQDFGGSGSVDGLVVSKNQLVHFSASSIGASPGDPEDWWVKARSKSGTRRERSSDRRNRIHPRVSWLHTCLGMAPGERWMFPDVGPEVVVDDLWVPAIIQDKSNPRSRQKSCDVRHASWNCCGYKRMPLAACGPVWAVDQFGTKGRIRKEAGGPVS